MKRSLIIVAFAIISISAWSQENRFTLSGGYAFANPEEFDFDLTGFRINGLYEYAPGNGKIAHGLSIGYIGTKGDNAGVGSQSIEYKVNSWPIYYAPKFMLGSGSAQGFIKGALGMQFSGLERTGSIGEVSTNDFGFYGGASVGFMKSFGEKMFINLEYEWAYLSNSYYKDGFMNTAMLGVGFKF
jgi:hypothetical protein